MSNVETENENIIKEQIEEPTQNAIAETAPIVEAVEAVTTVAEQEPSEIISETPAPEPAIAEPVAVVETPALAPEPAVAEPAAIVETPEPAVAEPVAVAETPAPEPAVAEPVAVVETPAPAPEPSINDEEKAKRQAESKRLAEEKQKQFDASFAKLKSARENGSSIEVFVKDRIKGGLRVMFDDVPIFLPASHFGLRRNPSEEELAEAIGKNLKVYIHELTEDEDNRKTVIVSRKKAITDELWATIKVGDIVEGTVSSVATFGIFLDLGGLEGLIHISRLSQVHVSDTKTIAKRGDLMKAVIVEIDMEKNRIALSRKDLEESPWKGIEERYPIGTKVKGTVRRFTDFGAYIEIEKGVDSLLRIGELSWTKRIKHPSEVISLGQEIEVEVLTISEEKNTMHISYKKALPNPWDSIKARFEIGKTYNSIVKQVMTQGCVVTIENEVDGFMPRSKMRQLGRGKKIPYTLGEAVEIVITDVVPEQESIIIEPRLDEADILAAEQEDRARDERPQQNNKKFDNKKPEQNIEVPSGSFSMQDLLSDLMKEKMLDKVK